MLESGTLQGPLEQVGGELDRKYTDRNASMEKVSRVSKEYTAVNQPYNAIEMYES